jgi:hypothetical protein
VFRNSNNCIRDAPQEQSAILALQDIEMQLSEAWKASTSHERALCPCSRWGRAAAKQLASRRLAVAAKSDVGSLDLDKVYMGKAVLPCPLVGPVRPVRLVGERHIINQAWVESDSYVRCFMTSHSICLAAQASAQERA